LIAFIILLSIATLLVYFFGGKFFLRNTEKFWGNIASVVGLVFVVLFTIFSFIWTLPLLIIVMIAEYYDIFGVILMIVIFFLPSVVMFAGMCSKRNEE
jgi:hypothetical protein